MLQKAVKMASTSSELIGTAGHRYLFKELIQERPHLGRVWLATSERPDLSLRTRGLISFQIRTGEVCLEGHSQRYIFWIQREYMAPASRKSIHTVTM